VTTDPLDYPFWLASRSAGIVAYVLLSASVILGLATATKLVPARNFRVLHERLALLALGSVAAHGLMLLADGWLHPGLSQILIPFTTGYRPVWTGLGILAAYGAAGLSLTYYARRRLGNRRWRNAHRFIPIAWALAAAHVIGAGTDAVSLWLQVILAATIAAVVVLIVQRGLAGRTQPAGRKPARTGGGSAGTEPAPTEPAPARHEPPERKYAGELGLFR
jgi:sulfoxide reductase heme-binding subunit YedZ